MGRYRLVIPPHVADVIRSLHPDLKRSVRNALRALGDDPSAGSPLRRELEGLWKFRNRLTRNFHKPSSSRRKNDPADGSSPRGRRAFLTLRFRSGCKRRMTSATCGGMTSRYRPIYRRRLRVGRSGSPKTSSKERPWPPAAKYRRLRRICRMSAGSLSTSRVALRRSYSAKFTSTAAGLPLRVTTISSSRSSTPVNSSGRCVFTSEIGRVRPMRLAFMSTRILVGEYLDSARRSIPLDHEALPAVSHRPDDVRESALGLRDADAFRHRKVPLRS